MGEMKREKVVKIAAVLPVSAECSRTYDRRGHIEDVEPTPEDIALHRRAGELVAEIDENPFVSITGYDFDISVQPLTTKRWVFDESHEEWLARKFTEESS